MYNILYIIRWAEKAMDNIQAKRVRELSSNVIYVHITQNQLNKQKTLAKIT